MQFQSALVRSNHKDCILESGLALSLSSPSGAPCVMMSHFRYGCRHLFNFHSAQCHSVTSQQLRFIATTWTMQLNQTQLNYCQWQFVTLSERTHIFRCPCSPFPHASLWQDPFVQLVHSLLKVWVSFLKVFVVEAWGGRYYEVIFCPECKCRAWIVVRWTNYILVSPLNFQRGWWFIEVKHLGGREGSTQSHRIFCPCNIFLTQSSYFHPLILFGTRVVWGRRGGGGQKAKTYVLGGREGENYGQAGSQWQEAVKHWH